MIKIRNIFYITLFIICTLLLSQERDFQAGGKERRIALIIGNAHYKSSPLWNPVNDAADMARVLRRLGFDVMLRTDVAQKEMENAIREFGNKLRRGGVGLFYFSGHGMQVNGVNYLIPVNEDIQAEDEIKYKAVDANFILSKMESAGNAMNNAHPTLENKRKAVTVLESIFSEKHGTKQAQTEKSIEVKKPLVC